jgi:flagellar motor switch protein FliN/FliY
LASDISNIIKEELANTLEQLLSKTSKVEEVEAADISEFETSQSVEVDVKFDFKGITTSWKFFVPTISATKFEYFMLGGMGDLKEHIDDEITDAVNEIISNVCGSMSTASNAQNFDDLGSVKFEVQNSEIVDSSKLSESSNIYKFLLSMDDENLPVLISFDEIILPFIGAITGNESSPEVTLAQDASPTPTGIPSAAPASATSDSASSLLALLGEESVDNLKLLFDIKLKLSVRLGTKLFLLKDILRWDIGEIIELEQMVNEPLEILVNGNKIGEGEAVIVEGKFGLKIRSIGNDKSVLSQIGLG